MRNSAALLLALILLSTISSALTVTNQSVTQLTKIVGQSSTITINLFNNASYSFYNISLVNNSYLSPTLITEIQPYQVLSINLSVISDQSFDTDFIIKGFYNTTIGVTHQNYTVNIDFYDGLNRCDFSVTKGDAVTFTNNVNDPIVIRNSVTGNDAASIEMFSNYTMHFDFPTTFSYYMLRRGYIFTPTCTITVLSDSGLINNPEFDGVFHLKSNVIYNPTNVSAMFLVTNYTVQVFGEQGGLMSLTNTGNLTAKNVKLYGDWFIFSPNNFDLDPGQTKPVAYTISPILNSTNSTNKLYNKTIMIYGNFQNITQNFSIFVPYANIDQINATSNFQSLIDLLKYYCETHPSETFCQQQNQGNYIYKNGSDAVNVTFTTSQVKGIFDYVFKIGDDLAVYNNQYKEEFDTIKTELNNSRETNKYLKEYIDRSITEKQSTEKTLTIVFVVVGFAIVITFIVSLIIFYKKINKKRNVQRW